MYLEEYTVENVAPGKIVKFLQYMCKSWKQIEIRMEAEIIDGVCKDHLSKSRDLSIRRNLYSVVPPLGAAGNAIWPLRKTTLR